MWVIVDRTSALLRGRKRRQRKGLLASWWEKQREDSVVGRWMLL